MPPPICGQAPESPELGLFSFTLLNTSESSQKRSRTRGVRLEISLVTVWLLSRCWLDFVGRRSFRGQGEDPGPSTLDTVCHGKDVEMSLI